MTDGGKARVWRFEDAALGPASGGSFSVGSEVSVFAAVLLIQRCRTKVRTRQVRRDDAKMK